MSEREEDKILSSELSSNSKIGRIIAERYELLRVLGSGGMSEVYLAQDRHMNREVAIKMLHSHLSGQDLARQRFNREAKALSSFDHANIVKIFAYGISSDGEAYMVMEFLPGRSLDKELADGILLRELLLYFATIASALAYSHEKGIVHRDLKPGNVIVMQSNGIKQIKIVDFGIAKVLDTNPSVGVQKLTQTGALFGSPSYMSPEQCLGKHVDKGSDLYSFGCMLFEALANSPPFVADSQAAVIMMHLNDTPPALSSRLPKQFSNCLKEKCDAIMARCLAKDPMHRYSEAGLLERDLRELLALASAAEKDTVFGGGDRQIASKRFDVKKLCMCCVGVASLGVVGLLAWNSFHSKQATELEASGKVDRQTLQSRGFGHLAAKLHKLVDDKVLAEADFYAEEIMSRKESRSPSDTMGRVYSDLAAIAFHRQKLAKWEDYQLKALENYRKLLPVEDPSNDLYNHRMSRISDIEEQLAKIIVGQPKRRVEALEFAQSCLRMRLKIGRYYGVGSAYKTLADIYLLDKNYKKAVEYTIKSIDYSSDSGDRRGQISGESREMATALLAANYPQDAYRVLQHWYLKAYGGEKPKTIKAMIGISRFPEFELAETYMVWANVSDALKKPEEASEYALLADELYDKKPKINFWRKALAKLTYLKNKRRFDKGVDSSSFEALAQSLEPMTNWRSEADSQPYSVWRQVLCDLGSVQFAERQFDDAFKTYLKLASICRQSKFAGPSDLAGAILMQAISLDLAGKKDQSLYLYLQALNLYKTDNSKQALSFAVFQWPLQLSQPTLRALVQARMTKDEKLRYLRAYTATVRRIANHTREGKASPAAIAAVDLLLAQLDYLLKPSQGRKHLAKAELQAKKALQDTELPKHLLKILENQLNVNLEITLN